MDGDLDGKAQLERGQRQLFVVGAERSGSTMVRLMLDGHPQLSVPFEFDFATEYIREDGTPPAVDDYQKLLATHRIFLGTGLPLRPHKDYDGLVRGFMDSLQVRTGAPVVGATLHHEFDHLPRLWPEARYIHLLRDGRDVSKSVINMGWAGNLWCAGDVWLRAERAWDRLRPQLRDDQWMELRYEDLVSAPEKELRRVCDFAGVPYHEGLFSYQRRSSYSAPDSGFAFQWRKRLSARELGQSEARLGPVLQSRGYSLSGNPIPAISPVQARALRFSSRLYKLRHRIKVHGPTLFLADVATRKIPGLPQAMRASVRAHMNQREIPHLK